MIELSALPGGGIRNTCDQDHTHVLPLPAMPSWFPLPLCSRPLPSVPPSLVCLPGTGEMGGGGPTLPSGSLAPALPGPTCLPSDLSEALVPAIAFAIAIPVFTVVSIATVVLASSTHEGTVRVSRGWSEEWEGGVSPECSYTYTYTYTLHIPSHGLQGGPAT